MRAANFRRCFCAVFGSMLVLSCGQGEQKDAASKTENLSRQNVKDPQKLPGEQLRQAGQTLNKAASVEGELARKAEENDREIEKESK